MTSADDDIPRVPDWVPVTLVREAELLGAGLAVQDAAGAIVYRNRRAGVLVDVDVDRRAGQADEALAVDGFRQRRYLDREGRVLSGQELPGTQALTDGVARRGVILGTGLLAADGSAHVPLEELTWLRLDLIPVPQQHSSADRAKPTGPAAGPPSLAGVVTIVLPLDYGRWDDPMAVESLESLVTSRAMSMARSSVDLVSILALDGRFLYASPAAREITGYRPDELMGMRIDDLCHPEDMDGQGFVAALESEGGECTSQYRLRRKDGTWRWVETTCRAVSDPLGGRRIHASTRDVGERVAMGRMLASVVDQSPIGLAVIDADHRVVRVNNALCDLIGRPPGEIRGRSMCDFIFEDDLGLNAALAEQLRTGEIEHYQIPRRFARSDGSVRWVRVHMAALRDAAGEVEQYVVQFEDADAATRTQIDLQRSEARMRAAIDGSPQATLMIDARGTIVHANPAAKDQVGRPLAGERLVDAFDWITFRYQQAVAESVSRPSSLTVPARFTALAGEAPRLLSLTMTYLGDRATEENAFVAHLQIDAMSLPDAPTLVQRASIDTLTGVATRDEVLAALTAALRQHEAVAQHVAALFCDLNGFKAVNDRFGHALGDEVLRRVAGRLQNRVRKGDTVGRLGGDEFLVVLQGVNSHGHAVRVGKNLARAVAETPMPDGVPKMTISVGCAVSRPGIGAAELVGEADRAMYASKVSAGSRPIAR